METDEVSLDSCKLYTIAWVAALPVERAAAEAMLDEEHEEPQDFEQHPSDNNQYSWGRMGAHNIVIAALPSGVYGTTSAAFTVAQLSSSLPHIKIGVLVGIAGAIPHSIKDQDEGGADYERINDNQDIRLGDVVVGRPDGTSGGVVQYDLGKSKVGRVWERKGSLSAPPTVLLSALSKLESAHKRGKFKMPQFLARMWETNPYMATSHGPKEPSYTHQGFVTDRLFKSSYNHPQNETDCRFCEPLEQVVRPGRATTDSKVHYGIIASGNTLVKDATDRDRIAQLTHENCICFEMEAAGIVSQFPCLVIRGICDYADSHKNDCWQPYASATAAAFAKELLSYLSAKKLESTVPIGQITALYESLNQVKVLSQETNNKIDGLRGAAENAAKQTLLSQLLVSDEARYNSYTEGSSPLCLRDTRVEVFSDILAWVEGDGARVFWLEGTAGTGKSTISRTFAGMLDDPHQLGASFFFKRGETGRNTIRQLSSTIAADLALRYPVAGTQIVQSISDDPNICAKAAYEQFNSLVLKPLSCIKPDSPIIIIIDALDECDDAELHTFFSLVSAFKSANLPTIKLFLTSRPDLPILKGFGSFKEYYENVVLQNIEKPIIERDIRIFLEHELRLIRDTYNNQVDPIGTVGEDWPSAVDVHKLLKMANKLFIFAATICRLLSEGAEGNPATQLRDILSYATHTGHAFQPTYLPVLDRQLPKSLSKSQKTTIAGQVTLILGAITIVTDPLSLPALVRLVDLDIATVEHRLNSLRSVLEVAFLDGLKNPEATQIRFLHISFRDYLLSSEIRDVSPIWVDEKEANRIMSLNCLRVLKKPVGGLKLDICNLRVPGTPRSTVTKEHINECMSQELRYACTNAPHHLKVAAHLLVNDDVVHQFLLNHFLHWLEALSLLGFAFEALTSLRVFQELLHIQHAVNVTKFLTDAGRFIQANMDTLDKTPLQIYSSALAFAPRSSVIRHIFERRYTSWIKRLPTVENNWGVEVNHFKAHGRSVFNVFFSPDGNLIASISYKEVQVSSIMGKRVLTFEGTAEKHFYDGAYVVAAFSLDSKLIAMGDETNMIQIWDIAASKCIHLVETTHEGERKTVYPIYFADGGCSILTTSQSCAEIWSLRNGAIVRSIKYPFEATGSVFSPCNSVIAVYFEDCIILWNINSGEQVRKIEHDSNWAGHIEFISSPKLDIRIRRVRYSEEDDLETHISPMSGEPYFSAYRHNFASTSFDEYLIVLVDDVIQVYNAETGELKQTLPAPRDGDVIAYSPKSSLLAVSLSFPGSEVNGIIFFLKLEIGQTEATGGVSDTDDKITTTREREQYWYSYFTSPSCAILGYADKQHINLWPAREDAGNARVIERYGGTSPILCPADRFLATVRDSKVGSSRDGTVTVWELEPTPVIVRQLAYKLANNQYVSVVFFSRESSVIGWVVDTHRPDPFDRGGCAAFVRLFSIETGNQLSEINMMGKFNSETAGACISSDHLLFAVAGYSEVVVWEIGRQDGELKEIFATSESNRALFTDNAEDILGWPPTNGSPVEFSADSSVLLFIRRGILEIWNIKERVCLQRISNGYFFQATIKMEDSSILTDVGRISYNFIEHLTEDIHQDSGVANQLSTTDKKSLSDTSSGTPLQMNYTWVGWGLSSDRCWITWNGENWFWLPLGFRPQGSAISNGSILLANEELGEMRYEFSNDPILEDRVEDKGSHFI